jgi:hypothetical protein
MKKEFKSTLTKLFPAVICILVFIVSGCNQDDWEIKSDRCVFLEHHISTNGEIIEGNYIEGPGIDSPTFTFDSNSGILSGVMFFDINKSLKVIYGNGRSLGGVAGYGVSTSLLGIYKLPYNLENFKIENVESNGTIHFQYKDSTIVLKSKEEWLDTTTYVDIQNNSGEIAKARLTNIDRFVNYGIIEKSKIEK